MNTPEVQRLYPHPCVSKPLSGLYLCHRLRERGNGTAFVYTNFIASLDGRISQPRRDTYHYGVPPAIANEHDWRLYLELAVQADVVVTTGRHLRAISTGRRPNLLGLDRHPDLAAWRRTHNLTALPTIAAVTETLDVPEQVLQQYSGPLLAITGNGAPEPNERRLREAGMDVARLEEGPALNGRSLVEALVTRGFRNIYVIGGPRLAYTLIEADVLDRLYLTLALLILGGRDFDTLTRGELLAPARGFSLRELYLDTSQHQQAGQLLATFDRNHRL